MLITNDIMPQPKPDCGPVAPLVDAHGRIHDYLRISVTDRCNLRCTYCRPAEGIPSPHPSPGGNGRADILTFDEVVRIVRVGASAGVCKVRLTGGEPLVRRGIVDLVRAIAAVPGIRNVAMTSNGVRLASCARELRAAGLGTLNVSLDTLRPERFREITLREDFHEVCRGIEAALDAGFAPLKLNVVVLRGFNDDELVDFAELTRSAPLHVRFIEFMPFLDNRWAADSLVSYDEILATLRTRYELLPGARPDPSQPAEDFAIPGHVGRIGVIASITRPFCGDCSRLRLTADGSLKKCLFTPPGASLRDLIRSGASDTALLACMRRELWGKAAQHPAVEELVDLSRQAMIAIGG